MTIRGALQALAVEPFLIHEIPEANRMTLVMDNRREAEAVVEEKRSCFSCGEEVRNR